MKPKAAKEVEHLLQRYGTIDGWGGAYYRDESGKIFKLTGCVMYLAGTEPHHEHYTWCRHTVSKTCLFKMKIC